MKNSFCILLLIPFIIFGETFRASGIFEASISITTSTFFEVLNIEFGAIDTRNFQEQDGLVSKASILTVNSPLNNGWFVRVADWEGETLPGENWKMRSENNPNDYLLFQLRVGQDAYGRATSLEVIDNKTSSDPQGTIVKDQERILDTGKNHPNKNVISCLIYAYILPGQLHIAREGIYRKYLSMEFWAY